jgi:hypothetical protein
MCQSEKYEVLKAQEEFYEKILRREDPLCKPLPLDEEALKKIKRQLRKLKELKSMMTKPTEEIVGSETHRSG